MRSPVFICYNKEQRNYFRNNNCNDVVYGIHPKSGKYFWVFIRNEFFNNVYEKWLSQKV